jgi:hypothetical protein
MSNHPVIPIKQIQLNQKHVPLIVSYLDQTVKSSFDSKETGLPFQVQLKLDNVY